MSSQSSFQLKEKSGFKRYQNKNPSPRQSTRNLIHYYPPYEKDTEAELSLSPSLFDRPVSANEMVNFSLTKEPKSALVSRRSLGDDKHGKPRSASVVPRRSVTFANPLPSIRKNHHERSSSERVHVSEPLAGLPNDMIPEPISSSAKSSYFSSHRNTNLHNKDFQKFTVKSFAALDLAINNQFPQFPRSITQKRSNYLKNYRMKSFLPNQFLSSWIPDDFITRKRNCSQLYNTNKTLQDPRAQYNLAKISRKQLKIIRFVESFKSTVYSEKVAEKIGVHFTGHKSCQNFLFRILRSPLSLRQCFSKLDTPPRRAQRKGIMWNVEPAFLEIVSRSSKIITENMLSVTSTMKTLVDYVMFMVDDPVHLSLILLTLARCIEKGGKLRSLCFLNNIIESSESEPHILEVCARIMAGVRRQSDMSHLIMNITPYNFAIILGGCSRVTTNPYMYTIWIDMIVTLNHPLVLMWQKESPADPQTRFTKRRLQYVPRMHVHEQHKNWLAKIPLENLIDSFFMLMKHNKYVSECAESIANCLGVFVEFHHEPQMIDFMRAFFESGIGERQLFRKEFLMKFDDCLSILLNMCCDCLVVTRNSDSSQSSSNTHYFSLSKPMKQSRTGKYIIPKFVEDTLCILSSLASDNGSFSKPQFHQELSMQADTSNLSNLFLNHGLVESVLFPVLQQSIKLLTAELRHLLEESLEETFSGLSNGGKIQNELSSCDVTPPLLTRSPPRTPSPPMCGSLTLPTKRISSSPLSISSKTPDLDDDFYSYSEESDESDSIFTFNMNAGSGTNDSKKAGVTHLSTYQLSLRRSQGKTTTICLSEVFKIISHFSIVHSYAEDMLACPQRGGVLTLIIRSIHLLVSCYNHHSSKVFEDDDEPSFPFSANVQLILSKPDIEDTVIQACSAIHSMAKHASLRKFMHQKEKSLMNLVFYEILKVFKDSSSVIVAVLNMLRALSDETEWQVTLLSKRNSDLTSSEGSNSSDLKYIPDIIFLMEDHLASPELQLAGNELLAHLMSLSHRDENVTKYAVFKTGIISVILLSFSSYPYDANLQGSCCSLICALLKDPLVRKTIRRQKYERVQLLSFVRSAAVNHPTNNLVRLWGPEIGKFLL